MHKNSDSLPFDLSPSTWQSINTREIVLSEHPCLQFYSTTPSVIFRHVFTQYSDWCNFCANRWFVLEVIGGGVYYKLTLLSFEFGNESAARLLWRGLCPNRRIPCRKQSVALIGNLGEKRTYTREIQMKNFKSAKKIQNTARLSCKLIIMILMVWRVADRWQYDAGTQHDGEVVV
jgi:hypothetical protein